MTANKEGIRDKIIKTLENIVNDEDICYYDLDTILKRICKLGIEEVVQYDVLIHRFFESKNGYMGMPDGWFCHIVTFDYKIEDKQYEKNRNKSIKVFGANSAKEAVVEALRTLLLQINS